MSKPRFFLKNIHNQSSGGVKYIHHLVLLLREKGYEAYLVLPRPEPLYAAWLEDPAPAIHNEEMLNKCKANDIVIDFWNDINEIELTQKLPAKIKVMCWIGAGFLKSKNLVGDAFLRQDLGYTHFWTAADNTKQCLLRQYPRIKRWHVIHHYFRFDLYNKYLQGTTQQRQILALKRKGARYVEFAQLMFGKTKWRRIPFLKIDRRFTEPEFFIWAAASRFFLHTAVGFEPNRSIFNPLAQRLIKLEDTAEVFPLPPAESTLAGSVVIGFVQAGDHEWLDKQNAFIAQKGSYLSLYKAIKQALQTPKQKLEAMNARAKTSLQRYNKSNTWREIEAFLAEI